MEDYVIILVVVAIGFVIVGYKALKEIKQNGKNKKM